MDIVNFWNKQVEKWNCDNKCDMCWEFHAPLVLSQLNITQTNSCCVNIFLTDVRFREEKNINQITTLTTSKRCIWNFSIYALVQQDLGVNNFNEIKGHPVDQSKWSNILYPIIQCLGCDNILDFCEILGEDIIVTQNGDAVLIHNYLDSNYNGWKINYTFSKIN